MTLREAVIELVRHRLKIVISKAVIHEVVYPFLSYICLLFKNGGIAQLARALAWHARGHRFESDYLHFINPELVVFSISSGLFLAINAAVMPHFEVFFLEVWENSCVKFSEEK